jgi:hypothetical protein
MCMNKKKNFFQYSKDLEKLDICFAKYYFDALKVYVDTNKTVPAWQTTFSFCEKDTSIPLIYMALGVNAHVNNDLGMSLQDSIKRDDYKKDFDEVNAIIYDSLDEVIQKLYLPFYFKPFMNMFIRRWRSNAWTNYDYLRSQKISRKEIERNAGKIAAVLAKVNSARDFYQLYHLI